MERLEIEILASVDGLEKSLNSAQSKIQSFSNITQQAGVTVNKDLAVPIAALGETSNKAFSVMQQSSLKSAEALKLQRAQLQGLADLELKPQKLVAFNQQIEQLTVEINKMSNAGKTGFDEVGNAVEVASQKATPFEKALTRATDASAIGGRVVSQFSRQIISLGTSFLSFEIGAKALKALFEQISQLDVFTGRLDVAKQTLEALTAAELDANKTAAPQIANLQILYDKTQDVTKSLKDRVSAAESLRDQFPSEFQNTSALAIVNGKAASAYRDLASSILEVAKSQAAKTKITEAAGKILDAQSAIDDAKTARDLAIKNAKNLSTDVSHGASAAAGGGNISAQEAAIDQANFLFNKINTINSGTIATQNQVVKNLEKYVTEVSDSSGKLKDANDFLGTNLQNFSNLIKGSTDKVQLSNIETSIKAKLEALKPGDKDIAELRQKLQIVEDLIQKTYTVKASSTDSAKEAADKIKKIYSDLAKSLEKNTVQFGKNDTQDLSIENVKSYQKAIDELIQNGYKPESKAIQDLIAKQTLLKGLTLKTTATKESIKISNTDIKGLPPKDILVKQFNYVDPVTEKLQKDFEKLTNTILKSGIQDAFASLGNSIGSSLASGSNMLETLGSSLLTIVGHIATQLGEAAIGIGTAMIGIKFAFTNPYTAIAAGIALVALGAFISSEVSNMTSGNSSNSGNSFSSQKAPIRQFADGGIISGPTFGLMGEYPGASSNPEVVAPLNKLKGLLSNNSNNTNDIIIPDLKLRGEDIFIAFKRVSRRMGALG